jgi:crotonobetainyl-CoA:carnitine CoA-transferase CaiB-like acyl-CoA transferase
MKPILAGRTVIELGSMLAGPFAAHMLAQLGAEVIKIEPLAGDTTRTMVRGGAGGTFIAYNRGKRSLCLDLKSAPGREVLHRLIRKADIVLHNLAPASMRSLGVTDAECRAVNADIVYCHIQGYAGGPKSEEIASNPVIEAATGVMHAHRVDGRPTRLGPSYHDQFAGAYAVIGILAALQAPPGDTDARRVEVGLYETGLHIAGRDYAGDQLKAQLGVRPTPGAQAGEFSLPGYGAYESADGRWMYLIMLTDTHWNRFCEALGLPAARDATLATMRQRKKRRAEVEQLVTQAIGARSFDDAAARLRKAGVGLTEVMPSDAVLADAQARQPGTLQRLPFADLEFDLPNLPLPHQRADLAGERPPPLLGEHTAEILRSAGYTEAELRALRERGVVAEREDVGTHWAPASGPGRP